MTWYLTAKEKNYNIKHTWMYESKIKALKDYYFLKANDWINIQYPTEEKPNE